MKIADAHGTRRRPHLTANGPRGGSLEDVRSSTRPLPALIRSPSTPTAQRSSA